MPPRNSHTPLDPITMQRSTRRTLGATSSQGPEQHSRAGLGRTGGAERRGEGPLPSALTPDCSSNAPHVQLCSYTRANTPSPLIYQPHSSARALATERAFKAWLVSPRCGVRCYCNSMATLGRDPFASVRYFRMTPPPLRTQYRWIV